MNKGLIIGLIILIIISAYYYDNKIVTNGSTVTVKYWGSVDNRTIKTKEITFKAGSNEVIKGLDIGVIGMKKGEIKELIIPPELAYGYYDESLVKAVPISLFNNTNVSVPVIGEQVILNQQEGVVINKTSDYLIIDLNNPLADKTLNITVEVLNVK